VVSHLGELELQLRVQELEFTQLATALEEARITGLASVPEVQVLYKATKQDAPFRPIKLYHVGLSGFLALMIGIALAYMADFLRSSWNPPAGGGPAEAAQAAGAAREAKRTGMYVPSADKG
jgi:uncharacterized protein involved in exopolysaccharide biosynthesis